MAEAISKQGPINVPDGDRPVVLHPEDNDKFVRTGKQVIASCRLGISLELWLHELHSAFEFVQQWIPGHADKIRACVAAAPGSRIAFFFIPTADRFDFDLADALADLNINIVRQFNIGMVDIHQIPWDEQDRFFTPDSIKVLYGELSEAHPAVEA